MSRADDISVVSVRSKINLSIYSNGNYTVKQLLNNVCRMRMCFADRKHLITWDNMMGVWKFKSITCGFKSAP